MHTSTGIAILDSSSEVPGKGSRDVSSPAITKPKQGTHAHNTVSMSIQKPTDDVLNLEHMHDECSDIEFFSGIQGIAEQGERILLAVFRSFIPTEGIQQSARLGKTVLMLVTVWRKVQKQ